MSDFDSFWNQAAALLDGAVDDILGDRIRYKVAGGAYQVVPGFAIVVGATVADDYVDEVVATRKRVKVGKAIVALPSIADRVQHPNLGDGTFRPLGKEPETEGRYWIFDVEKVQA